MITKQVVHTISSWCIGMVFFVAIFIPFSLSILDQDKLVSKTEKRKFAQLPEIPESIEAIKVYPQLFDKYYSDQFGLRNWFNYYYKLAKFRIGDSPSSDVTIGKRGWLFLGHITKGFGKNADPIGDYRNLKKYSEKQLKKLAKHMITVNNFLKVRGVKYVFVIAPNKHTIYSEYLPDYILKENEFSLTDQLVGFLKKNTDVIVVDLRQSLINEKANNQLYYKTDTHWNHYGANIAQYEIMLEIQKLFPTQIEPELQIIKNFEGNRQYWGLAKMMGLNIFKENNPYPVFENTCKPKKQPLITVGRQTHTFICEDQKLNAVVFCDSFMTKLGPYFSRKFKRSTYIRKKINYESLVRQLEMEKPDLVIEEWVERKLPQSSVDKNFLVSNP